MNHFFQIINLCFSVFHKTKNDFHFKFHNNSEFAHELESGLKKEALSMKFEEEGVPSTPKNHQKTIKRTKKTNRDVWTPEEVGFF